jgi:6-phosphogluconolactonase (cycloisomerase 2 family)
MPGILSLFHKHTSIKKIFLLAVLIVFYLTLSYKNAAAITDGQNAIGLIGQYDSNFSSLSAVYTKAGAHDSPNSLGFSGTNSNLAFDSAGHRLFVSDTSNSRVLVYNLNADNTLPDRVPDNVLGQDNFYSNTAANTQAGLNLPTGIAYDATTTLLFVAEQSGNRVKVFNVAAITNGEAAVNVLGQANFTDATAANTQAGLNLPVGVEYDPAGQRLFVTEFTGNRVKVFDLSDGITDGENAAKVLGQTLFTGATAADTQGGMRAPSGVEYDQAGQRLFVVEQSGNRIKVYDLSGGITDGMNAANVLGQTLFTTATAANTQGGLNVPYTAIYDGAGQRLFVSEASGNRVKVYDLSGGITDGMNAANVLGQTLFTTATAATTQAGINVARGMAYDSGNQRLYVANSSASRITVYNVTAITDGEDAVDLLGQYDDTSFTAPVPHYTKSTANNAPNKLGLFGPTDVLIDSTNHRMFIADATNSRVIVHTLDASDDLVDYVADYVIGQADFASRAGANTQAGLNIPRGLAYDATRNWLFVAEASGHRVKVFDISDGITNGENAIHVLGQTTFTGASGANTISGLNGPFGIEFDDTRNYLYVGERSAHRVKIFDVTTIVDGEDAIAVIGQSAFTTATAADTQTGIREPMGLKLNSSGSTLFVAQCSGNRVTTYDVTSFGSTTESAVNVLGQSLFTTNSSAHTQSGMHCPTSVEYDNDSSRLFVGEWFGNRVKVFDLSDGTTDGENAANVLGQSTFTGSTGASTQSGMITAYGLELDDTADMLWVSEGDGNRIKLFDIAPAAAPGGGDEGGGGSSYSSNVSRNVTYTTTVVPNPNVVTTTTVTPTTTPIVPVPIVPTYPDCLPGHVFSIFTGKRCSASVTPTESPIPQITGFQFERDLYFGIVHGDVKILQKFLNDRGFIVATVGNGSPGQEITTFGPATRAALAAFQKVNNISPSIGYFGPLTRERVNKILSAEAR